MSLRPGEIVDRFALLALLGEGGQAEVWSAAERTTGALVALKLLRLTGRANVDERARREARALATLSHPSLLRCRALFEDPRRQVVGLVLDLVDGSNLDELRTDPRFGRRERAFALLHVAGALAQLHDLGVVHRDVKLSNVLVDRRFFTAPHDPSLCKLMDLGISTVVGNPAPLTALGHPGTVGYMAPEALEPGLWRTLAARPPLDVFAFGVAGWILSRGRHPSGLVGSPDSAELSDLYASFVDAPGMWLPPDDLPDPLDNLLARCLRLSASERPQTGGAVFTELSRIASGR